VREREREREGERDKIFLLDGRKLSPRNRAEMPVKRPIGKVWGSEFRPCSAFYTSIETPLTVVRFDPIACFGAFFVLLYKLFFKSKIVLKYFLFYF
jgi:hypothetical protein